MEKKYESLTLFEFQEKFSDNDSCQNWRIQPISATLGFIL